MVGVEEEGALVLDDADRQAQAVEDRAHPLRVALGQVVVDRDDVHAAPGHGVERGGERRDERLALAGLHLGDLALVQHDAADQLDVEMAHAQLAPADLAGRGEDLRQRVVEHALEVLDVLLLALPGASRGGAPSSRWCAPRRTARWAPRPRGSARASSIIRARISSSVSASNSASSELISSTTGWSLRTTRSFESRSGKSG